MSKDAITPNEPNRERGARKARPSNSFAEGEPPARHVSKDRLEEAKLRLIRKTWGGMLVSFNVELDGAFAGELSYVATLDLMISPGKHVFTISGGGAFFGASERFIADENEVLAFVVSYSWYGGIKIARVF